MRRRAYMVGAVTFVLAAVSCGGGGAVAATLADFSITLDSDSAPAGEVTFNIQNNGPSVHEFVVIKTDLAPDALPTTEEDGVTIVDEEGPGIEPVDEVEDIPVGESPDLTVNLDAGSYVLICNISENGGHYLNGMHTGFTVE
jgi:uncharacterized cupredoxin-like copper-binding protein